MRGIAPLLYVAVALIAVPAAAQDHYLFGNTGSVSGSGPEETVPRATLTFDGITPYLAVDTGWIKSDGSHLTLNPNYLTGHNDDLDYNSFFNFNIGALAPVSPYTSATLTIKTGTSGGVPPFDLTLFDVDASYLQLDQDRSAGDATGQALFADLGSGTSYGFYSVPTTTTIGQTITINLNQTFLNRVNGGLLTNFSIGGTLAPSAVAPGVPEPATWAMMLVGFGFVGGTMRAARRRQQFALAYG